MGETGGSWRAVARSVLGLVLLASAAGAQNLVVNGSMDGPVGFDILPPGWNHDPPTSNTFDPGTTTYQMAWSASADGGSFVHSTGSTNPNILSEGLSQVVSGLIPGASYQLSFEQSATWGVIWTPDTHGYWEVTFGGQTQAGTQMALPQVQGQILPWQPQTMQFTAGAASQLLRFAARDVSGLPQPWWLANLGLDGVELCQVGLCGGAPQQWLYTVDDANVLRAIDPDGCGVTTIGVTQDTPSGPLRRVRGLAFVPSIGSLLGMTREGDLVRVDPYTATTTVITSLPFGDPTTEFWGGLAFDGVDTLYTANAFDGLELVAIKVPAFTSNLVGSTLASGGVPRQILGLDVYPASAPLPGTPHPQPGVLYGSDRSTGGLVRVDTNTALVTDVGANLGAGGAQALAFHPYSGSLFCLDDLGVGTADLVTYDFGAQVSNGHCALPFGIVEQAATPDFGWGGAAFTRPGSWSDQGCALAGVAGDPLLVGTGTMLPGSPNTVTLSNAAPGANSLIFLALSSTPVPFMGGVLKPFPFLPPLPVTLPATGSLALGFNVPGSWPSGTELWVQWAIQDVTAVFGVALSNAIVGVVP